MAMNHVDDIDAATMNFVNKHSPTEVEIVEL